jgi:hypothetical protein
MKQTLIFKDVNEAQRYADELITKEMNTLVYTEDAVANRKLYGIQELENGHFQVKEVKWVADKDNPLMFIQEFV